jgi:predicted amidohydrolase
MNDKNLHLSIIQSEIFWEDINKNLGHLDALLSQVPSSTDLILLPEMFTTGFSMNICNLAEDIDGKTLKWMQTTAIKKNAAISGSIIFEEKEKYYNRLFWVNPDGKYFIYNKRHLFHNGNEDKFYERGYERLIVNFRGWRICPLICYDLRFPVWSRNNNAFDLLLYVANWPAARNHVWNILLRARAIENQCFVAGTNRVGRDGENIHYIGESCVIHPKGYPLVLSHEPVEQILNCTLSLKDMQDFRMKFPVLNDADELKDIYKTLLVCEPEAKSK